MSELTVLQAVRLKGRVITTDLAQTLGEDLADVAATVDRLTAAGLLVDATPLRISPSGRMRLDDLLAEERNRADSTVLAAAYRDFRSVNADFKRLVTDWQLKGEKPNTRRRRIRRRGAVRLDGVHRQVGPIIGTVAMQLPRLSRYPVKLRAALDKVKAGDIAWLTRPLIDSYHTVWFELHEELIQAVGLTRDEAAKSGDAQ